MKGGPIAAARCRRRHVAVTGGAGFLGINLVRHLLDRGWTVSVLDLERCRPEFEGRVRMVVGDVRDPDAVRQVVSGVDCMVHAAAALPLRDAAAIRSVDVDGTRVCLEVARQAGLARFVHISSTAVYGIHDDMSVGEDSPLDGLGPYGEAKVEAEHWCSEYRTPDFAVTILRPKSFIGPERLGIFGLLYEWAASGRGFPLPGGGRNRFQLLDVFDLCQAIELALAVSRERTNLAYNIGATDFGTLGSDFQAVLDYAGFGKRVVPLPARPAGLMLNLAYRVGLSPVYPWVFRNLTVNSAVDVARARNLLGFEPRYSNRDALIRNFEWYLGRRDGSRSQAGDTHTMPWKQGALGLAKRLF